MQVKLTKIYTTNKDKNGNELKSAKGVPYTRMSIKTEQYGDKWISGFQNKDNKDWKEGDEVEVNIEEKGEYMNFSVPKKEDKMAHDLEAIHIKLGAIYSILQAMYKGNLGDSKSKIGNTGVDYPSDDIDVDDIPF